LNILVIGGDKRQQEVINCLLKKQHIIDLVGFKNLNIDKKLLNKINIENVDLKKYHIIIFPVTGINNDLTIKTEYDNNISLPLDFFERTKPNCIIFSGIRTNRIEEMNRKANRQIIYLMEYQDVAIANSIPTTEGIIMNLVENTDYTIHSSNILVLGYGNVGKTLVRTLDGLGANVSVLINNNEDYERLIELRIDPINSLEILKKISKYNIIINTIPSLILDKNLLDNVKKDSYILDIASAPGGVDYDYANKLNIKNNIYQGIPGKIAPVTAGKILYKKINNIIKGEN
jgi:dipicolinate synthase subunit A